MEKWNRQNGICRIFQQVRYVLQIMSIVHNFVCMKNIITVSALFLVFWKRFCQMFFIYEI